MTRPSISIVVISKRKQTISRCIQSLISQTYNNKEILIIWNGDKQYYEYLASKYSNINNVKIVTSPRTTVPRLRNLGIQLSSGNYIAFTDDDCIPDNTWLEILYSKMNNEVKGVGSIRKINNYNNLYARLWQISYIKIGSDEEKYNYLKSNERIYLCTSSALFEKEILAKVGGFDENLISGEDYDISRRLVKIGSKLILEPRALVLHDNPESVFSIIKQQIWYGRGHRQLANKNNENITICMVARCNKLCVVICQSIYYSLKIRSISLLLLLPIFTLVKEISAMIGFICFKKVPNAYR